MVAEEWTFRWQEGVTNFETFDYQNADGSVFPFADGTKAEMIVRAATRGTKFIEVDSDDEDELIEITVTAAAGNVLIEIDPALFTGKSWPDTTRASVNLIRPDNVKVPFVRGPVVIVKE